MRVVLYSYLELSRLSVTFLIVLICLYSCSLEKSVSHDAVKVDSSERFVDSLIDKGQDTILVYVKGCSGCVSGYQPSIFIFWNEKSNYYVKSYSYLKVGNVNRIYRNVFNYYNLLVAVSSSTLVEPKYPRLLHYKFSKIIFIVNGIVEKETVVDEDYMIIENIRDSSINFIYFIESLLFRIN